jgi:hypothetical protein
MFGMRMHAFLLYRFSFCKATKLTFTLKLLSQPSQIYFPRHALW